MVQIQKHWPLKTMGIPQDVVVVQSLSCILTLWPQGLQHARLLCPPLSPRVCANSCPLSQWCYLTISSSVTPFSSCPWSFPVSGSLSMSQLFPLNTRGWFPLGFKESTANAGYIRDSDSTAGWKDHPEESVASTSVFLPGESPGQRSLVGYSL